MNCRPGCGACCIAPSISSAIPGMPAGKAAGLRCVQLSPDNLCRIFGLTDRPKICCSFKPDQETCGTGASEALHFLETLELLTQ